MSKKVKCFMLYVIFGLFVPVFANTENCSQTSNNQHFVGVFLDKNKSVTCCYNQNHPWNEPNCYELYGNYIPISGPWHEGAGNLMLCNNSISTNCAFEKKNS